MFLSGNKIRRIVSIIYTLGLSLTCIAYSEDQDSSWPQFHGPNRNNISTEKGLLNKWPDNGLPLLWTASGLGHGYSSISIANGMIFTAGSIEGNTVITAVNLDGKVLWKVKNGKAWTGSGPGSRPGTRGTPTIEGNRLYHQSPLGDIICLDYKTSGKIWQLNIIEKFKSKLPNWALAESLLIDSDHLISTPGGPQTCMVALNKGTGAVIWKSPAIGEVAGYASPALFEYKGLRIITTLTAKSFIGVNADTGEMLWRIKHESYADENVLMPIFHNGRIFVSTLKTGSIQWSVNVNDGKVSLEEIWRTNELDNHHGGVILVNGNLYGSSTFRNRNLLVCLDWITGNNKYMDKSVGKVSLTYADGMLYVLSIDGAMGLVRPAPDGQELISSFEIPKGGIGNSWAHPVVCGGRLYIRHGDFLYAYSLK